MIIDKHCFIQSNGTIICISDYQDVAVTFEQYQHIDNPVFEIFPTDDSIDLRQLRDYWSDNVADALRRTINYCRDNYKEITVSGMAASPFRYGRISISNDLSDEEIVELIHIMLMNEEVNKNDR